MKMKEAVFRFYSLKTAFLLVFWQMVYFHPIPLGDTMC